MAIYLVPLKLTINLAANAEDLAAITNNLQSIQTQLNELEKYYEWAGMKLSVPKCAITGCPNKSKIKPDTFKAKIQAQNIRYRSQPLPVLHQNEPYMYLGIQLVPSPKPHHYNQNKRPVQKLNKLSRSYQKNNQHGGYRHKSRNSLQLLCSPILLANHQKLDKKIIGIQKIICGQPKCTANVITQLPQDLFGLEAFSLKIAYLRCISKQLINALYDPDRLGIIYKGLIHHIPVKYGGAEYITRITHTDCIKSPATRTLFLIKRRRRGPP